MAKEFELMFKLQANLGSKFKDSFNQAKKATQDLESHISKTNKTAGDIAGYKKTQLSLETNIAKQKQYKEELAALEAEQRKAGGASTQLAAKIASKKEALERANESVRRSSQSLSEYEQRLKEAGVDTSNLSKESAKLAQEVEKARAAQERTAKLGALQAENQKAIGETKSKLTSTIGVIAAVGTATMVAMQKASDATDRVDKLSQKIGMSRKGFQEWDFILSQSGTNIEKMQVGMKTLVNRMQESAKGSGVGADALKKLGISATDSSGKMKMQEQVMEEVVRKMQDMPEGAEKSKLAFDLFGKSGLELMPLLNSVGGSVDDLKAKAHELGIVLSDEAIDAGVNYQDAMDQLKRSLGGVATQILSSLMPTITIWAGKIGEVAGKVQKFAAEHPKLIQLLAKVAGGLLLAKAGALGLKLGFLQAKGGVLGVLGVISRLKAANLIGGISKVKTLIMGMSGGILPVIAAITAIAVAIKLVMGNVDAIREKIRGVFGEGGVAIFDKFVGLIDQISDAIKGIFGGGGTDGISGFFNIFNQGGPIMEKVGSLIQSLTGTVSAIITVIAGAVQSILPTLISVVTTIASTIGNVLQTVLPVLLDVIGQILPVIQSAAEMILPLLAEAINALMPVVQVVATIFTTVLGAAVQQVAALVGGLTGIFSGLIDFIAGVFTGNWGRAWEGVKNIFGSAFNALIGIAKAPINAVISLVNKAIGALNTIQIPKWVPVVGGKGINIPKIPTLWKGSAHTPDTFIAGEQGPELVMGKGGSKVFTAHTTKGIFTGLKDSFISAKEMLTDFPTPNLNPTGPSLALAGAGGGRNIVINSQPHFHLMSGDPTEIGKVLDENNEKLKREIKEEMENEEEDRRRRGY
ncbi:phage tail tape measure protein, TP901 family [Clostridiales bacterium KA00134]|nr:phage tail tape measure protein, TP901 family [Clostridiales bacterium KA00134]